MPSHNSWLRQSKTWFLRHYYTQDPDTGDPVSFPTRVSLVAQSLIRRWTVFLIIQGVTVVWWIAPQIFHDDHTYVHWQLFASDGALVIEQVIGIGMYALSRRDSKLQLEVHHLMRRNDEMMEKMERRERRMESQNLAIILWLREMSENREILGDPFEHHDLPTHPRSDDMP